MAPRTLLAGLLAAFLLVLVPALAEGSEAYANTYALDYECGQDVDTDLTSIVGRPILFVYSGELPSGLRIDIDSSSSGWFASHRSFLRGTLTAPAGSYTFVLSDDTQFYEFTALVTAGTCTVTYDAGIGLVKGERTWSETISKGSYASLPSATHSSGAYTFLGWAEKAGAQHSLDSYVAVKDCVLHAVWKRNSVSISDSSATVTSGQTATLPISTNPRDASITVVSRGSLPAGSVSVDGHDLILDMKGVQPGTYYVTLTAGSTGYISGESTVTVRVPITIVKPIEYVLYEGDPFSYTPVTNPSNADVTIVEVSRDGTVLGAHGGLSVDGRTITGTMQEDGTYSVTYTASLEGYVEVTSSVLVKVLEREEDPAVQLPAPVMGSITISPRAGEPRVFDLVLSGYGNASNIEWLVGGRLIASSSPTAVCELPASGVHTVTCRLTGLDGSVLTEDKELVCKDNYHREAAWAGVAYGYVATDEIQVEIEDGSPFTATPAKLEGKGYVTVSGTPSESDVGSMFHIRAGHDSWTITVFRAEAFAPIALFDAEVLEDGRTVRVTFTGDHASAYSFDFDGDGIPEPGNEFAYADSGRHAIVCTAFNNVSETSHTRMVELPSERTEEVHVISLTDFRMEAGERMDILVSTDSGDRLTVSGTAAKFVKVDGGSIEVEPTEKGVFDLVVTVSHADGSTESKTVKVTVEGSEVDDLREDRHDLTTVLAVFFVMAVIAVALLVLGDSGRLRRRAKR